MSSLPNQFIAIDEEGFLVRDELRLNDPVLGQEVLNNLKWHESGALVSTCGGQECIVESFDSPLVAKHLEKRNNQLWGFFSYELEKPIEMSQLTLDPFDRFRGNFEGFIPFVLNRKAQMDLFNLADEYDDDSLTFNGVKYELEQYYPPVDHVSKGDWWSQRYEVGDTGWDLAGPSPVLVDMLPRMRLGPSRILVLGAGRAHDAAFLAQQGHFVTAVDISENAIADAKKLYGHIEKLKLELADMFKAPPHWLGSFDIVWEHTCFAAIEPARRTELIQVWKKVLTEQGQLMGVFMTKEHRKGPPFGLTEWELRERLHKSFQFLYWGRWRKSAPGRQGKELFVLAKKKSL